MTAKEAKEAISRCNAARKFPTNTCPASRHVQLIAEALLEGELPAAFEEDRRHIGESMLSVVTSLYEARTELAMTE